MNNFVVNVPKFTGLLSPNAGGIAVVIPAIDIRDQSCPKSRQILHVFGCNIFWGEPPIFWT